METGAIILIATFLLKTLDGVVLCSLVSVEPLMLASTIGNVNAFGECLLDLKLSELLHLKSSLEKINRHEILMIGKQMGNATSAAATETATATCGEYCSAKKAIKNSSQETLPNALALTADERGFHHHSGPPAAAPIIIHPWQPEEKPSKLQTLFQISVTALSFLSFGGYLLCLIVQAIKSKGTTYFHPVATATTNTGSGGVRRIKIYRRSRRSMEVKYDEYQFLEFPSMFS